MFAVVKETPNIPRTGHGDSHGAVSRVFCYIWYPGVQQPYVAMTTMNKVGWKQAHNGSVYMAELLSCPVPDVETLPVRVSMSFSKCTEIGVYLPVQIPPREEHNEFGVCVPAAYGTVPLTRFVEWVEFYRLFGVTEFNVYNSTMTSELQDAFKYYQSMGLLNVLPLSTPLEGNMSHVAVELSEFASMNDCMMRNMYNYKYMVLVDFDEFIIPSKDDSYAGLLRRIDKAEKLAHAWYSYSFRNAYHFDQYPEDETQPWYLHTMRYRFHQEPSKHLFRCKSFIDPRTCLSTFHHYCMIRFDGLGENWTVDVNTELALSHHYRSCEFETRWAVNCKRYIDSSDDVVFKYRDRLNDRVLQVYKELGLDIE